jgi:hypothetical protein
MIDLGNENIHFPDIRNDEVRINQNEEICANESKKLRIVAAKQIFKSGLISPTKSKYF